MEVVALDVDRIHLGVADLDALFVGRLVEDAVDRQSGFRRRGADQFDDRRAAFERPAAPVLRDVAGQAMLDPRLREDMPCSISTCPADSG